MSMGEDVTPAEDESLRAGPSPYSAAIPLLYLHGTSLNKVTTYSPVRKAPYLPVRAPRLYLYRPLALQHSFLGKALDSRKDSMKCR